MDETKLSLKGDTITKFIDNLGEELQVLKEDLDSQQIENLIKEIDNARCIFVMGVGRSGYIAKAFAMRLMHLGYDVYVVGETVTPRLSQDDLLVSISGSGETNSVVSISKKAKDIGARMAAVTRNERSTLAQMSNVVVLRKAKTKVQDHEEVSRLAPLGTMFETTALVLLDGVVAELMERKGLSEENLLSRHAVLE